MRKLTPLLLIGLAVTVCRPVPPPAAAPRADPDQTLDDLLTLMRQRLDVMHDVARTKWVNKVPIEDRPREESLLAEVAGRGRGLDLPADETRVFFAAQIQAGKLVQRSDFRRWEAGGHSPQGEGPDLAGTLRPRIDALNRGLLDGLARIRRRKAPEAVAVRNRADALLRGDGIDAEVRATAIGPLLKQAP